MATKTGFFMPTKTGFFMNGVLWGLALVLFGAAIVLAAATFAADWATVEIRLTLAYASIEGVLAAVAALAAATVIDLLREIADALEDGKRR